MLRECVKTYVKRERVQGGRWTIPAAHIQTAPKQHTTLPPLDSKVAYKAGSRLGNMFINKVKARRIQRAWITEEQSQREVGSRGMGNMTLLSGSKRLGTRPKH